MAQSNQINRGSFSTDSSSRGIEITKIDVDPNPSSCDAPFGIEIGFNSDIEMKGLWEISYNLDAHGQTQVISLVHHTTYIMPGPTKQRFQISSKICNQFQHLFSENHHHLLDISLIEDTSAQTIFKISLPVLSHNWILSNIWIGHI